MKWGWNEAVTSDEFPVEVGKPQKSLKLSMVFCGWSCPDCFKLFWIHFDFSCRQDEIQEIDSG